MIDPCKLCGERVKGSAANAWWWHGQDIYHVKCMWDEIAYLTAWLAEAEALLKEAVEYDEVELPDDWYARAAKLCGLRVITGNVAKAGGCDAK